MAAAPQLPSPLAEHQDVIESALREHIDRAAASGLPLYRMMQYHLGWVGQDGDEAPPVTAPRFYGAACLEAAACLSTRPRDLEAASSAGVAAELLYASVTVHEDMQSTGGEATEHPPVWWLWGPAQAINVGDGLHALARLAAFQLQERGLTAGQTLAAVGGLDAAALRYYEGQYLELTFQERVDVTEAQYLKMATAKRGSLFGGATALGAQAVGATEDQVESLRSFGERLGVAAQIAEDVALIWPRRAGTERSGRVLNKSKLYPLVHALEHSTVAQKRRLGNIYFKRVMEPSDLEGVREVLDETGSKEHAVDLARTMSNEAMQDLEQKAGLSPDALERWQAVASSQVAETSVG